MTDHLTDIDPPIQLGIEGMTCAACANRVERALNKLEGVTASVNYATEKAHILGLDDPEAAIAVVTKTGYTPHLPSGDDAAWAARAAAPRVPSPCRWSRGPPRRSTAPRGGTCSTGPARWTPWSPWASPPPSGGPW